MEGSLEQPWSKKERIADRRAGSDREKLLLRERAGHRRSNPWFLSAATLVP
jgi:hypothetical protein